MKRLVLLLVLCIPTLAMAQVPQGFDPSKMMEMMSDPAAMQRMMQEAQAMQVCMQKIDQSKLDATIKQAEVGANEIDRLCKSGKRAEALQKAIALGSKMRTDPTFKELRTCTEGMTEMMQAMPFGDINRFDKGEEPTSADICD
jgi:hypothetical protein